MGFGKVLLIGYGSIGKRHAKNLIDLGIIPHIVTRHPDGLKARFLKDVKELKGEAIKHCIISSPTASHLDDLRKCKNYLVGLKSALIEKPLECSYERAIKIKQIADRNGLEIFTAYNLRFLDIFNKVKGFVKGSLSSIKIVEIVAGQDLRSWRPYKKLSQSYSAHREQGGGVDLDLSHELDYALWLFGDRFKNKFMHRAKISSLKIDSPDIFKIILNYRKFIVDISLDYIRSPKERYLKIICDNGKQLYHDFTQDPLGIDDSYKKMLKAFLGIDRSSRRKLCSLKEGLNVLKVLEV
jgi:predicted dehydrogenase